MVLVFIVCSGTDFHELESTGKVKLKFCTRISLEYYILEGSTAAATAMRATNKVGRHNLPSYCLLKKCRMETIHLLLVEEKKHLTCSLLFR